MDIIGVGLDINENFRSERFLFEDLLSNIFNKWNQKTNKKKNEFEIIIDRAP